MQLRRTVFEMILEIARRDRLDVWAVKHCCGMTRPRASNLVHGRIDKFNTETLIDILAQLGVRVDIQVLSRQQYIGRFPNPRPGWRRSPHVAPELEPAPGAL